MKSGFSLGMDVTVDEEGKYNASISYLDTEDNEICANATGDDVEEVCWDLYEQLVDKVAEFEDETEDEEDMSDEDYIAYLESKIAQLQDENESLRETKQKPEKNDKKSKMSDEDILNELNKILDDYRWPSWWKSIKRYY